MQSAIHHPQKNYGFHIVIVETATEQEAAEIMTEDPAVKQGVMTARLLPYRVALMRD